MRNKNFEVKIALIKEGKIPSDNRVALTPQQCKTVMELYPQISIYVQHSAGRCFSDDEYKAAGITVTDDISHCDVMLGIKEVPVEMLIDNKTYLFFSHTKKLQPYNRHLLQEIIRKNITLIDYECLEHEDGARIIGFGFFAGVVGAHNGMLAFGKRTGAFSLQKVSEAKTFQHLIHTYFGLKIPPVKIVLTGSGRVSHGLVEIVNLLGIHEVEPEDFLNKTFKYPVYAHLKGALLYEDENGNYSREDFHKNPANYKCKFHKYIPHTDILMNGIYWDKDIPRLFEMEDISKPDFKIQTIADVTDDMHGSVPCNLGDSTIEDPVYGVDKKSGEKTEPFLPTSIDIMAVGNLPNELPRDASTYFGEQMIKFIIPEMLKDKSDIIYKATITKRGSLNTPFLYMNEYASI